MYAGDMVVSGGASQQNPGVGRDTGGERPRDVLSVARAQGGDSPPLAPSRDVPPRPGEIWSLAVTPPPWYAGVVGTCAVIDSVAADSVYVVYATGMRECFPAGRFQAFFRPKGVKRVRRSRGKSSGVEGYVDR